ncbi:YfhO family protein [Lacticaseibacillus jixiensis]|uniref:YfhO family protein n=1 Tax=Lacticaseibacillus jixiensis TaxID=3231926 RepID=UPI0036F3DBDD
MRLFKKLSAHPYWLAFCTPILVMSAYFIAQKVYPFGNSSLLTVDLGQQYIDFYSYFRQTVFGHPGQLLYAFNKDLGADMYSVYAYYLLSPYNFIVCLFPKSMLDSAIVVMTLAKYGSASLAMAYYLRRHDWAGWWLAGFGTVYALSGWMLANQLNLMWLDIVICLPLVCSGVDELTQGRRPWRFIWWLFVAIFTNYYMGFMLCLFIVGYFCYALARDWRNWRAAWLAVRRFVLGALLAGAATAAVLLPTLYQITQSKGTYTVTKVHWRFEYAPVKLLGKFFVGSFNFDQMPSGQPNIFVGSLVMVGVILYFIAPKIALRERLVAGLWTAFLVVSMMYEPLDLLWHGMQFPVWYPYRFSFVVVFWLVMLGAAGLKQASEGITWWQLTTALTLVLGMCAYVWLNLKAFKYLSDAQVLCTVCFYLLALLLLSIRSDARRYTGLMFALFMSAEAATNAAVTLNQLSYVTHSDYHTYTQALRQGVTKITRAHSGTYRIGKTILRTKNDAMQIGYLGTDQFNSMFAPRVPKFFGEIGQSAGDGFVAYTAGTEITDAFLDLKYWLDPKPANPNGAFLPQVSARPDLLRYGQTGSTKNLNIYTNPYALGLGFAASSQILKTKFIAQMPVVNQELLMSGLTGENFTTLFHKAALSAPVLKGAKWSGAAVSKLPGELATVTYTFKASDTDPYYLQIPATFTDSVVSATQNGHSLPIYDTFRDPELLNVTPGAPHELQTITFTLLKDSADFGQLQLYRLNQAKTTAMLTKLKQAPWHITKRGDRSIQGDITIQAAHQVLMTTIPKARGWQVLVDGRAVTPAKALGLFMAIPLSRGQHTITMRYTPPFLGMGLAISLVAFGLIGLWWLLTPVGRHRRRR